MFVTVNHPLHHRTAVGPEHAAPVGHLDAGDFSRYHIDDPGGKDPEQGILSPFSDRSDHIEAALLPSRRSGGGDLLRRVLRSASSVTTIPPRRWKTGQDGRMLSVIPRQFHHPTSGSTVNPFRIESERSRLPSSTRIISQGLFRADITGRIRAINGGRFSFVINRDHEGNHLLKIACIHFCHQFPPLSVPQRIS